MLLGVFQVTTQRNTTAFCVFLLLSLFASCWWLFGLAWGLILSAVSGLSYCSTSYLCYRPEASEWRQAVADWYERLFVWGLNYSHASSRLYQGSHNSDTPTSTSAQQSKQPNPFSHRKTTKTRGEQSPGVTTQANMRPPQPQATGRDRGGVAKTGEEGEEVGGGEEGVQPAKRCHKEAQKIIQLFMRDFVNSWYPGVTGDTEFPEDMQKVLEHVALEVNVRLQQVELEQAVVQLLQLILPYLEVLNKTGIRCYSGVELFDVTTETCVKEFEASPAVAHHALKSPAHEHRHCRQALDALIQCALPTEYARCDLACTFIRELLLANIVDPLFDLLCDPAFLYEAIPLILSKATVEKVSRQLADIDLENEELERTLSRGRLVVSILGGAAQGRMKRRFHTSSGRFGQSAYYGIPPSPSVGKRDKMPRPHSIATFPNMQKTSSGVYESSLSSSMTLPRRDSSLEAAAEATYPPSPTSPSSPSHSALSQRFGAPVYNARVHRGREPPFSYPSMLLENGGAFPEEEEEEFGEEADACEQVMDGGFAVVELSPIFIERHVRVETGGSNPHTAYIFKVLVTLFPDHFRDHPMEWPMN